MTEKDPLLDALERAVRRTTRVPAELRPPAPEQTVQAGGALNGPGIDATAVAAVGAAAPEDPLTAAASRAANATRSNDPEVAIRRALGMTPRQDS